MNRSWRIVTPCILSMILAGAASAQTKGTRTISASISYVATGTVYINAGRERGIAVGDTLTVTRKDSVKGRVVVGAISSSSSSAGILQPSFPMQIGDSVFVIKAMTAEPVPRSQTENRLLMPRSTVGEQTVSGQVAFQYVGSGSLASGMDFSQPGLLMRLNVAHLGGSSARITMYGRTYRDLSPGFDLYNQGGSRTKVRMFEMSLSNDDAGGFGGYAVGRVNSRFVGGLGVFDGGQVYVRRGNFSLGALLGTQPDYTTSGINADQQKAAVFANYAWGPDIFHAGDITLAYAQQRFHGGLDRVFMYLQTNVRFSQALSMYENAEFDLKAQENGVRHKTFRPTNSFVTLSYAPANWINASAGYDAQRSIYLFKSMSALPDTLFDQNLQQGFRLDASIRAPGNISLNGQADYRLKDGASRGARTLGGGARVSNIAMSPISTGVRYLAVRGIFTDGRDVNVDADDWISPLLLLSMRFDYYAYTLLSDQSRTIARTASLDLNFRFSALWYTALSMDQVWENTRNYQRVYFEAGIHF